MSSRRRSRSRERSKNAPLSSASSSKLRMDNKTQTGRPTDPSLPGGRRREIENVMKKARASPNSNAYWDKKLLEVEAKDPNRWRHSGYKSLYIDGSSSPSSGRRSRSRSAHAGRRSPPVSQAALQSRRSPVAYSRAPGGGAAGAGSRRSPIGGGASRSSRSHATAGRPHGGKAGGGASGRRSASNSSISSCSDDSCSVCSPKNYRGHRSRSRSFSVPRSRPKPSKPSPPAPKSRARPRPPSPSHSPHRRPPRPMTPPPARAPKLAPKTSASDRPTDPRRQPPPPPMRPRAKAAVIDVSKAAPMRAKPKEKAPPPSTTAGNGGEPVLLTRIKKERTAAGKKRAIGSGESSGSEESDASSTTPIVATTRLTLSERFGKIAQWSADRERRDIENMRITKTGGDLKVMIEGQDFLYGTPPRRYSLSPVPAGHYPDELISSGQSRLAAWDDVRVRYQYYKDLGYLRDLSLDDYVKWEEWWYKYQDWLTNERHYEHWITTQRSSRRRKRIPATQRLN